jgi:hypothetical protein
MLSAFRSDGNILVARDNCHLILVRVVDYGRFQLLFPEVVLDSDVTTVQLRCDVGNAPVYAHSYCTDTALSVRPGLGHFLSNYSVIFLWDSK